jgi:hypothetical protein
MSLSNRRIRIRHPNLFKSEDLYECHANALPLLKSMLSGTRYQCHPDLNMHRRLPGSGNGSRGVYLTTKARCLIIM